MLSDGDQDSIGAIRSKTKAINIAAPISNARVGINVLFRNPNDI